LVEIGSVDRKARLCHDPGMDLEAVSKALSKRRAFSPKRVAFFAVAGLALAGGILLRSGQYFGQTDVEQSAPVTVAAPPPSPAPTTPAVETTDSVAKTPALVPATAADQQAEPSGDAVEQAKPAGEAVPQAEQSELPGAGMILVSRQPIKVLASPSSSAATTYGFPAGRPFRVIGHNGGFAQIQDVKSGASGWIDEAAVSPPPNVPTVASRVPAVSAPSRGTALSAPASSQPKPVAVSGKSAPPLAASKTKAAKKDSQVTADSEPATETDPAQTQKRPGLIGGLFGGIFGGGNGN